MSTIFFSSRLAGHRGFKKKRNCSSRRKEAPFKIRPLSHRLEVDDKYIVEHRAGELAELLVRRVIDVRVAVRFAFESQDETVSAAFVAVFLADVGTPFVVLNLLDFLFQIAESILDLLDLLLGRAFLEFERDDVPEFAFGF